MLTVNHTDRRVPVLVLLQTNLDGVCRTLLSGRSESDLSRLVVFSSDLRQRAPSSSLRVHVIEIDELAQSKGCLCCSMRSELATGLGQLFLRLLRRQEPAVAGVLIVSEAMNAVAFELSLKHAPFLGQRYRMVASLPLTGA